MVHDREAARVADRELPHRGMHDDPTELPNGGFPTGSTSLVSSREAFFDRFRLGPGRRQLAPRAGALTAEQVRQARALLTRPENSVAAIARLLGVSRSTRCTHIPDLGGGRWPAIEALQPTRSKGDV
jgi:hypothetical protein